MLCKSIKFISLSILISFIFLSTQAQVQSTLSASEIKLGLKKLDVLGRVLYIAAHPDDENTRLLTYLSKDKLVQTGYLSLTRGDGGQNLIGNEQSEELGLIRTQELLSARKIDGAQQFFTRANDFGFSKTAKETFNIWDKNLILSDVVYIIRKFKPDVIITRFPADERAGHGHHQASSILAQEAFVAAADPKKFPEQLKEVEVWQAKRLLWNNYNFGGIGNTSEDQLKIDVGLYNPLLGKSYGEIAAESRSMHKSQGFGSAKQRGKSIEYFSSWVGELPKNNLFEGIDLSWNRLKNVENIQSLIKKINQNFNVENPSLIVPDILKLYDAIQLAPQNPYKETKLEEVKNLILACTGTWVEASSPKAIVAVNTQFSVNFSAITQSQGIIIQDEKGVKSLSLESNQLQSLEQAVEVSKLTQPYWLEENHTAAQYTLAKQSLLQQPDGPVAKQFNFNLIIGDKKIPYSIPIINKYTDQVKGEVYQPLLIAPPVSAALEEKVVIYSNQKSKEITVRLKAFKDGAQGAVKLIVPKGWSISPQQADFKFAKSGEEFSYKFTLSALESATSGLLNAQVLISQEVYNKELKSINYDHIPAINYFTDASAKLVKLDLKTSENKRIGYIAGAGDLVPEMLKQIGYSVTLITNESLLTSDIFTYDAIITGVRAYNTNATLAAVKDKLMKYVEGGGIFLVQYNVNRPLVTEAIGPYPFNLSRDRITEENSAVKLLLPQHPALNYPNKITTKDFEGWIQERGLYFPTEVDSRYQQLLQMQDTDEKPLNNALIVADYGKGKFIYTGLSFFRELPAGVSGAYRLFVNLISK